MITTSDGIQLYIERKGNGVPCIYLHGGPGYWSKSFQHYVGESLEKELEMVYLDQRGCGRSQHDPNKNYSLDRLIEDIEEVRKELEIKQWYVMGHSFGGILALTYATRYPENTLGIILSNATLFLKDSFLNQIKVGTNILNKNLQDTPKDMPSILHLFSKLVTKLIEKDEFYKLQFTEKTSLLELNKIDRGIETDPLFQKTVLNSADYHQDFRKRTKSYHKSVLIIAGEHDHAIGPTHHKEFHFINSKTVELNSGHHPYLENTDEFVHCILTFIRQNVKPIQS